MAKNNDETIQTIYINMDDSGQLAQNNPNELLFVYGGVFFLSLNDQENFARQYISTLFKQLIYWLVKLGIVIIIIYKIKISKIIRIKLIF